MIKLLRLASTRVQALVNRNKSDIRNNTKPIPSTLNLRAYISLIQKTAATHLKKLTTATTTYLQNLYVVSLAKACCLHGMNLFNLLVQHNLLGYFFFWSFLESLSILRFILISPIQTKWQQLFTSKNILQMQSTLHLYSLATILSIFLQKSSEAFRDWFELQLQLHATQDFLDNNLSRQESILAGIDYIQAHDENASIPLVGKLDYLPYYYTRVASISMHAIASIPVATQTIQILRQYHLLHQGAAVFIVSCLLIPVTKYIMSSYGAYIAQLESAWTKLSNDIGHIMNRDHPLQTKTNGGLLYHHALSLSLKKICTCDAMRKLCKHANDTLCEITHHLSMPIITLCCLGTQMQASANIPVATISKLAGTLHACVSVAIKLCQNIGIVDLFGQASEIANEFRAVRTKRQTAFITAAKANNSSTKLNIRVANTSGTDVHMQPLCYNFDNSLQQQLQGHRNCLIGPSGAGKSMLLNAITGIFDTTHDSNTTANAHSSQSIFQHFLIKHQKESINPLVSADNAWSIMCFYWPISIAAELSAVPKNTQASTLWPPKRANGETDYTKTINNLGLGHISALPNNHGDNSTQVDKEKLLSTLAKYTLELGYNRHQKNNEDIRTHLNKPKFLGGASGGESKQFALALFLTIAAHTKLTTKLLILDEIREGVSADLRKKFDATLSKFTQETGIGTLETIHDINDGLKAINPERILLINRAKNVSQHQDLNTNITADAVASKVISRQVGTTAAPPTNNHNCLTVITRDADNHSSATHQYLSQYHDFNMPTALTV